jgi:hypothetical protein
MPERARDRDFAGIALECPLSIVQGRLIVVVKRDGFRDVSHVQGALWNCHRYRGDDSPVGLSWD